MYVGLETATKSSMRIRTKTLDTRPKYLGYTVRKKLKFCGCHVTTKMEILPQAAKYVTNKVDISWHMV